MISNFYTGIHVQSGRIPLRFFIEQLNHGFKLVLTGITRVVLNNNLLPIIL